MANLEQAQGSSPGGHLDNLTILFSRKRQTVLGKGQNGVPRACGYPTREMCGWQRQVGKWNSSLVIAVATKAWLVPTGELH